jgi:hypothetical protein
MSSAANDLLAIHRFGRRITPKGLEMLGVQRRRAPWNATYRYVFQSISAGVRQGSREADCGDARVRQSTHRETHMTSILISIGVAILTFAAGMVGLYLHKLLPEQHSVEKSREMIGSVIGLVTLLLALVLGTIVGSAYFFSSTQQSELQTLAAHYLQLDQALAKYGPETRPMRDRMKDALTRNYDLFWRGGDADPQKLTVATAMTGLQPLDDYLGSLDPNTPAQKQAASTAGAHFGQIEQIRLMISLQLANPFFRPLLIVVVAWSLFLFCGFGLLSQINATTLGALAFGAFAVASAIFLILELSQPYTGLFRTSPAALEQTIEAIDK